MRGRYPITDCLPTPNQRVYTGEEQHQRKSYQSGGLRTRKETSGRARKSRNTKGPENEIKDRGGARARDITRRAEILKVRAHGGNRQHYGPRRARRPPRGATDNASTSPNHSPKKIRTKKSGDKKRAMTTAVRPFKPSRKQGNHCPSGRTDKGHSTRAQRKKSGPKARFLISETGPHDPTSSETSLPNHKLTTWIDLGSARGS